MIKSDLEATPQRFDHILKLIAEIRDRLAAVCVRRAHIVNEQIDIELLKQMFENNAFDAQEFGKVCFFIMTTLEEYCSADELPKVKAWAQAQREILQGEIKYAEWIPQFFEKVHEFIDVVEGQIQLFLQTLKRKA